MRGTLPFLCAALCIAQGVQAQDTAPVQDAPLTLQDAIGLASRSNPAFLIQRNDQVPATWAVREAWSAFLPTVTAGGGAQYTAAGTQTFGIFTAEDIGAANTDYYFSDYFLRLNYQLSGATFFRTAAARASSRAVDARVNAARFTLATDVTRQYLAALRAQDELRVAERQLERAQENHELASARVRVGTAVSTEGKQAEVEMGRAEVARLRALNTLEGELLRLQEQIGTELEAGTVLSSQFSVFEPGWTVDELESGHLVGHPQVAAFEAEETAALAQMREARSSYFPTLTMSANWSGFTRRIGDPDFLIGQARDGQANARDNCEFFNAISSGLSEPLGGFPRDCSQFVLTSQDEAQLLEANRVFPFNFQSRPWEFTLRVSVPVFQGFTRQRQVEEAASRRDDAAQSRRAEELRLRTALATAVGDLRTAFDVVAIEERNLEVAEQQLALARERYRLGAANFLELLEAQSSVAEAERDHLNARYSFHDALVTLEAAVGRSLRPEGDGP